MSEEKKPDRLLNIEVSKIRHNPVALRPVDREGVEFKTIADSVKKRGVLTPISVKEIDEMSEDGTTPTGVKLYSIIDGLQRYTAAFDAGHTLIPAAIKDKEQAEIEEDQIIQNAVKVQTKRIEFTNAISRVLARNPTLTIPELSKRMSLSPEWFYQNLGMVKKLHDDIKPLVDDQKITVTAAMDICKLPRDEQPMWVDKAMTMNGKEFTANVSARVKEVKDAHAAGRPATPPEFKPVPHQRTWSEVKSEHLNGAPTIIGLLRKNGFTSEEASKAAVFTLAWMCYMDPDSQAGQIADHDAAKKKREADNEKKKLEKTNKELAEAAKTRQELEAKIAARNGSPAKEPELAAV